VFIRAAVKNILLLVGKTFGGPNDWRVGPVMTFLQGRQPVSRRARRRVASLALARARTCTGICWYSKLAADVCQIVAATGISRGERRLLVGGISLWMGLAKQDSFEIRLHVECGNSGLEDSTSAGCALRVPVRGSLARGRYKLASYGNKACRQNNCNCRLSKELQHSSAGS
jgi:hypothetical protein